MYAHRAKKRWANRYNAFMASAAECFEREFAHWLGVPHVIATGFGRSALCLALEMAGVRDQDVLLPNFICAQVPEAVRRAGARPVYYPVDRDLHVNPENFRVVFTPRTRVALVAHYFGRTLPEISQLAMICRELKVPLLEDCALALGASLDGRRVGVFGDVAIFSLTKSDWCYGGGAVVTSSEKWGRKLRAAAGKMLLRRYDSLSWRYGLLRRADYTANRPRWARGTELMGRWMQRMSGLDEDNFYDSGRFDAACAPPAARRARRILADLSETIASRQHILRRITAALGNARQVLFRDDTDAGDAASYLLVRSDSGRAEDWVEQAATHGVTLRRCWPAYQAVEEGQAGTALAWLAKSLLVLEIHPRLAAAEVERIVATLKGFVEEGAGTAGAG